MNCIVTGASRGIGYAIAAALAEQGNFVVGSARNENDNIKEMSEKYEKFSFVRADISCDEDRKKIIFEALKNGPIDLLVNNAGVAPKIRKDMLEITPEDFSFVTDINLRGTYFMTQAAANEMIKTHTGRIVNISSVSSYAVSINRAEYCIAKTGISMITKLFAARLAEYDISVFEIMPGIIETDMTEKVKDVYKERIANGLTPIKRIGTPEDVANCVLALSDGKLDFCTGSVIGADGGFSVRIL